MKAIKERILFVENRAIILAGLCVSLEGSVESTALAATLPQAFESIEREHPSLVVLEAGLPANGAWFLLNKLKGGVQNSRLF